MNYSAYITELLRNGIVSIPCNSFTDKELLDFAVNIGVVVPGDRGEMVQNLPARDKGEGPTGCFSYVVGYNSFPWHVDTAYWIVPVHYLLLASELSSPCATVYQDFEYIKSMIDDFDYLMSRAVFLLDIPGRKRYISPCFEVGGVKGYRLDFHIFRAVNEDAKILQDKVGKLLDHNYNRHVWSGKELVIIDNWRMIHAREDAHNDTKRLLKRIYINELV